MKSSKIRYVHRLGVRSNLGGLAWVHGYCVLAFPKKAGVTVTVHGHCLFLGLHVIPHTNHACMQYINPHHTTHHSQMLCSAYPRIYNPDPWEARGDAIWRDCICSSRVKGSVASSDSLGLVAK